MKRSYSQFLGQERSLLLNRETTSLPDELDGFYGRDGDKEAMIRSLLLSDDAHAGNLGVIPIVGMGGVGKTTLAQHVYNDKAVEEQFKVRAWVCVSDRFDVTKVTREIVKKVTGRDCPCDDLDQLQRNLKGALDGKKFLLVLDDVWSEDYNGWTKLLTPLRSGAKGSKIIITTRSKEVASKVQTVPTHDLRVLGYEDCWKLFARHACLDVNSTANPPDLLEIGKEIVRKCGGLPLAAKALGGVLRWQTKAKKWKEVLKSQIWDVPNANILPALAMSYIHLPSHLKRCFAYCAIFPQDYWFQKDELVALWLSEGFLVRRKRNQSLEEMEEIGDMYFDDLVSRSFFQQEEDDYFVMHDLVHDLARFVSGEFCSRFDGGASWEIGERTRHLSYKRTNGDVRTKFQGIHETSSLRSFILAQQWWLFCNCYNCSACIDKKVIDWLLLTRKPLRVLNLSCYGIRELPNSISNLKHMRHLNLSKTSIRSLPEAVTALFNLENLILRDCDELIELPAGMARLINLCQLDLEGTDKLKGMPPEMGKLKKLSKLSDFVVGENGGSSIKELGQLHYLRGKIVIRELQNVKDDRDASETILKDKENLKVLGLSWNLFVGDSRQAKQVLERLQPHIHIESIEIWGYRGTEFPNWVGNNSFSKLKQLSLIRCNNCVCLPPVGQLASLEELTIDGYAVLEAIGLEFYGMCKPGEKPFSSLKRLKFQFMDSWREWSYCNGAFPVLEEVELLRCYKLMSVPTDLPRFKRLRIDNCFALDIENLSISTRVDLETIRVQGSKKMKCISLENFPSLKKLDIVDCSNLESLVGSTAAAATATTTRRRTSDPLFSPSLTSLRISSCPKLLSFPRGGLQAPNLKDMQIDQCGKLKSLPQRMHSLIPSLEKLSIVDCPEIESLPEEGLPSSLQSLIIEDCKNLKSLPEEGLPSSLSSLRIWGCPLLEKRCKRETGEDWPKIKHVPYKLIR